MPKVLVVRPIADEAIHRLKEICEVSILPGSSLAPIASADEVAAAAKDADIILALPANPIPETVIQAAPRLKLIASMGTGYDNVDVRAARARGIGVTYAPGILDETTADFTFALLLATARHLSEAERFLRNGQFRGWSPSLFLGSDVFNQTLGIVGMGRIGRAVTRRAKGFGMRILYTSASRKLDVERECGAQFVTLDELLSSADFVSIHVPLRPETRHLIGPAQLHRMRPTSYLINTARGAVVDEAALADALEHKVIAGAGLDVFEREPEIHPGLMRLDNVVLVPHIASASEATRRRMALRAVENIHCFVAGRPLLDPVPTP
jgi:glyoxylate reductase